MPRVVTPIKRSSELAPLSREHHEGLLFLWKIRQGLRTEIAKERMARFCTWSWATYFQKEETELLPVLGADHPMMEKMLQEHKSIAEKIAKIMCKPTLPALERLTQIVAYHIRFEERQLFPFIEQTATPAQMAAIEAALAGSPTTCSGWRDEFWKRK